MPAATALWKVRPTLVFKHRTLTGSFVFSWGGGGRVGICIPKMSVALGYGGKRQPTAEKVNRKEHSSPIILAVRPAHIHSLKYLKGIFYKNLNPFKT